MSKNILELTNIEIQNLIDNHRRQNRTTDQLYLEALKEQDGRAGKGLSFLTTMKVVREAALERRFLSYKQLAIASGTDWIKVRHSMGPHLFWLVEYSHRRKWPLLSAIVVNQQNLTTGKMEPDTLRGFVEAVAKLGVSVDDSEQFLHREQERVFEWAQRVSDDR